MDLFISKFYEKANTTVRNLNTQGWLSLSTLQNLHRERAKDDLTEARNPYIRSQCK